MNPVLLRSCPLALSVAVISWATPSAYAEVLRWNLQDVRFNDGAIASGYFDLDTLWRSIRRHTRSRESRW